MRRFLERTGCFSGSSQWRERADGADGGEASQRKFIGAKLQRLTDGGDCRGGGGSSAVGGDRRGGGGECAGGGDGGGRGGERARAPDQRMVPRRAGHRADSVLQGLAARRGRHEARHLWLSAQVLVVRIAQPQR